MQNVLSTSDTKRWTVPISRIRQEKAVCFYLEGFGVRYFTRILTLFTEKLLRNPMILRWIRLEGLTGEDSLSLRSMSARWMSSLRTLKKTAQIEFKVLSSPIASTNQCYSQSLDMLR